MGMETLGTESREGHISLVLHSSAHSRLPYTPPIRGHFLYSPVWVRVGVSATKSSRRKPRGARVPILDVSKVWRK